MKPCLSRNAVLTSFCKYNSWYLCKLAFYMLNKLRFGCYEQRCTVIEQITVNACVLLRCMGSESSSECHLIIGAVLGKQPIWIITRWPVFQVFWLAYELTVCVYPRNTSHLYVDFYVTCKSTGGILLSSFSPFLFPFFTGRSRGEWWSQWTSFILKRRHVGSWHGKLWRGIPGSCRRRSCYLACYLACYQEEPHCHACR